MNSSKLKSGILFSTPSMRPRTIAVGAVVCTLLFLAAGLALFKLNTTLLTRAVSENTAYISVIIADAISPYLASNQLEEVQTHIDTFQRFPNMGRITVHDIEGVVIASIVMDEEGQQGDLSQYIHPDSYGPEETETRFDFATYTAITPITYGTETVGRVEIAVSKQNLNVTIFEKTAIAIGLLVGAVLFACLGMYFMARRIASTAGKLEYAMEEIRVTKSYSKRVESGTNSVCGACVVSFNEMLGEIQSRDGELEHLVKEFEKAMDSANEANVLKSQFMANMSHELRTPLNAIINYSEMIEEDLVEEGLESSTSDLKKIQNSARHLLRLIDEVLDLSKIESGRIDIETDAFGVDEIVQEVVETLTPAATRNGNAISATGGAAGLVMQSDALRLRQCLLNLAGNACKFTHDGKITINVEPKMVDGFGRVEFSVIDTGVGINSNSASELFEPFVQVDSSPTRKFGGTGLGLTITRRLAHLLGGEVSVESTPGKGSTFSLLLMQNLNELEHGDDERVEPADVFQIGRAKSLHRLPLSENDPGNVDGVSPKSAFPLNARLSTRQVQERLR